jgi:mannosylglycerate hydrolase MGH1-like protein
MTNPTQPLDPERERMADPGHLEEGLDTASPWYLWGPYVAERAWGSVREDYSADGDAWSYFPHDHARSRAYRWNEDGMAGISDVFGRLCLGLALWNGRDPILKERMFGLANAEGNHGEDVKDYWWYLDALPSSAWLRWRYHYPQAEFPYDELVQVNRERSKDEGEYELLDTGIFDSGYWVVGVDYAKADPTDILMRITVKNAGPAADTLHILPTLWFRNTWSWGDGTPRPSIIATDAGRSIFATHPELGDYALEVGPGPDGAQPTLLFCENETNVERLYGQPPTTPFPKDGINDHVVHGAETVGHGAGTKAAAWYRVTLEPGASAEIRLRLRPTAGGVPASDPLGPAFGELMTTRQLEADAFYAGLARHGMTADEALIMRQAFAGMLWCKQFYAYDVSRWLAGDAEPPPAERRHGRNSRWHHVDTLDILSMPDSWEYPWFAAWDLGFHAVTLAHIDPAFAKYQLLVLCREWFQHPDGALPAYEWSFDDVNPPVHAQAALAVWEIDGRRDIDFLQRIFHKLLLNFTWWLNRQDSNGDDLFSGGFLGLDNLSAFDRSKLPFPGRLEQSDATAWMFSYCMSMLRMASILTEEDPTYRDLTITFLEHAVRINLAINQQGLWDESDAFYYDALHLPDGSRIPLRIHSMVGLLPILPATSVPREAAQLGAVLGKHFARFLVDMGLTEAVVEARGSAIRTQDGERILLSLLPPVELERVLREVLDEEAFLSPHGLRALSRRHRDQPFKVTVGGVTATVDYEPGESRTGLFGGNSNWRGPVWFPVNYLFIESMLRWDDGLGETFTVEYPTGSGRRLLLREVAQDLAMRLVGIWLPDAEGRRPVYGTIDRYATDPEWRNLLQFHEYFHGDTGAGIGASHQTGWTGLVAHLLCRGGVLDRATSHWTPGPDDEIDFAPDPLAAGRN